LSLGNCSELDMGQLTEKPNRYSIFKNDADTVFGILKTGKYRIPKITE